MTDSVRGDKTTRVAGARRWLAVFVALLAMVASTRASGEGDSIAEKQPAPPAITEDVVRMMELGKLLMGQNNPAYALVAEKLPVATRNAAGKQALQVFQAVVKREPRYADGWLWLGITCIERLEYGKEGTPGKPVRTPAAINEGIEAFRTAYLHDRANEDCVKYYGDALMEFRQDFDTARKLWLGYLEVAKTDLQQMIAYVQAARACLNKAYFGKEAKQPVDVVRQQYLEAESYVKKAADLCPNARDVKEMQQLLQQHKRLLTGK